MVYGVDHLLGGFYFFTNGPLWFLLALFLSRVFFDYVHNLIEGIKANWGGYLLSAIISVGFFYLLRYSGYNIWSLAQASILYPYLLIGFAVSKTSFLTKVSSMTAIWKILSAILLFAFIILMTKYLGKIDYGSLQIGSYPVISFCVAIVGTFVMVLFASSIKIPWISQLGKETLVILGFHHPFMDVVKYSLSKFGVDVFSYSLIICVVVTLMTIFLCHIAYLLLRRMVPVLIGIKANSR